MRRILGIDPGKDGAGVLLAGDAAPVPVACFLTAELLAGRAYVPERMAAELRRLRAEVGPFAAVLELAAGRGGEGAGSARTIGEGWGLWRGILAALEVPTVVPASGAWTRAVLRDAPGDDPKARSIVVALARVPSLDLAPGRRRRPHDGIAQAACLALYGYTVAGLG